MTVSGDELRGLAQEQAALRRVATLVARGAAPQEVFAAAVEEVGRLLPVDLVSMARYEPDRTMTFVTSWGRLVDFVPIGSLLMLGGNNLNTIVFETGRPARIESYDDASGPIGVAVRDGGVRSAAGAPIMVEGRLWGIMSAGVSGDERLPAETEARLASFTELLAMAIANAESRAGLAQLAQEQAALRRVATLVARGTRPEGVFAAAAEEVGQLLPVDHAALARYEPDGSITVVSSWGVTADRFPVGSRWSLEGPNPVRLVLETGRAARVDNVADVSGPLADAVRDAGVRSGIGAPIVVEGRLWGVMAAGSTLDQPLPANTEARLADFTELLATAIANAASREALAASRARIVAATDEARRRIERDLHDGTQQQLVSLMLELRAAEVTQTTDVSELRAQVARTERALAGVLEELREISRGIHPAMLSRGGLAPALEVLARRSGVPVKLDLRAGRRLAEHVEVAAYYVVSEGLTNVAKHAHASVVNVALDVDDAIVRLAIRDDGVGGADPEHGSGLIGLCDRVEALGGTLQLTSASGRGTTLLIEIPLEVESSPGSPGP
jgi:signal transduction histidine kinase